MRWLDDVMYRRSMKRLIDYADQPSQPPAVLNDRPYPLSDGEFIPSAGMVRTQIYLTRAEHEFITSEAARLGAPMAAIIRDYIDEKMRLPDAAWESNPMLETTPRDPGFALPEDAAINHDHYLYGAPKKYLKRRGKWVLAEAQATSPS